MSKAIRICLVALLLALGFVPRSVAAFSVLFERGTSAPETAALAARWSAEPDPFGLGTGLHDRIQVAVHPTFGVNLGASEVAALYQVSEAAIIELAKVAVRRGFEMWQTSELQFEITFDADAVVGPLQGSEIDLFSGPFPILFFGFADVERMLAEERLLTNGQRLPGDVIVGADVFINTTRILEGARLLARLGIRLELLQSALQILVAHEIGHALGLDHPNQETFFDTDTDPFNPMPIDFADPFRDLIVSSIPLNTPGNLLPIMWGGLSSQNPADLLALLGRLNDPALTFDDRGGRDVLYPSEMTPTPTPSATATATVEVPPCLGDCDGDRQVTVDELIVGVNIALGEATASTCRNFDRDGDGSVYVDDLIAAISIALSGCS